jgi:hypothetical protein
MILDCRGSKYGFWNKRQGSFVRAMDLSCQEGFRTRPIFALIMITWRGFPWPVGHPKPCPKMLRNEHHGIFVSLRILLDQIFHRFHQYPLSFHVPGIGFPRLSLAATRVGHFWLDRKCEKFGHQDTLIQTSSDAASNLFAVCRPVMRIQRIHVSSALPSTVLGFYPLSRTPAINFFLIVVSRLWCFRWF